MPRYPVWAGSNKFWREFFPPGLWRATAKLHSLSSLSKPLALLSRGNKDPELPHDLTPLGLSGPGESDSFNAIIPNSKTVELGDTFGSLTLDLEAQSLLVQGLMLKISLRSEKE